MGISTNCEALIVFVKRHAVELERNKVVTSSSLSDDSMLAFSSNNSTKKTEDDNYGFVDALAMKISHAKTNFFIDSSASVLICKNNWQLCDYCIHTAATTYTQ
ncbi:hypothetical protein HYC85_030585 [Camellia sinensis]|uniref:Uncharacterized protein n=1 Tax=Camellia sinensis TaxID=4442 RepID=A0A7J7G503_CAMSI|nr:hypothetical protein HYC85_030585 [Camellia sinensis]